MIFLAPVGGYNRCLVEDMRSVSVIRRDLDVKFFQSILGS